MKAQQLSFKFFLGATLALLDFQNAKANSVDFINTEAMPNYSISTPKQQTESFQLSVPSESVPYNDADDSSSIQTEDNNYSIETSSNSANYSCLQNIPKQTASDNLNYSQSINNLNAHPNPLLYPTKPEEVKVQTNQAITLEQALELARRNNKELQTLLQNVEIAQYSVRENQASLLPSVQLTGNLQRSGSSGGQPQSNNSDNQQQAQQPQQQQQSQQQQQAQNVIQNLLGNLQPRNIDTNRDNTVFNSSLTLNYTLDQGGARYAAIGQAEENLRLAELQLETREEQLRLDVSQRYFNVQQANQNIRIRQAAIENARISLEDAQNLRKAGASSGFEILQAQVILAQREQEFNEAIASQQIASRELVNLLGSAQSVDIEIADPVKLAGLWKLDLEQSIIKAYQNRSELQQNLAERNIAEFQRRAAFSGLRPQISLTANYQLEDRFDDNVSVRNSHSIGIQGSLQLYDGGRAKNAAARAKTQIRQAETSFAETRKDIRLEVERAYSNLQSNQKNVNLSCYALEQARKSLDLARLRFKAGVDTQLQVIQAEDAFTTAESNFIQAILGYNNALVQLQRSTTSRALSTSP